MRLIVQSQGLVQSHGSHDMEAIKKSACVAASLSCDSKLIAGNINTLDRCLLLGFSTS